MPFSKSTISSSIQSSAGKNIILDYSIFPLKFLELRFEILTHVRGVLVIYAVVIVEPYILVEVHLPLDDLPDLVLFSLLQDLVVLFLVSPYLVVLYVFSELPVQLVCVPCLDLLQFLQPFTLPQYIIGIWLRIIILNQDLIK